SRGKIGEARKLAGAAGEHHASARLRGKRRGGKPVAHHFQDFLDPRLDDAHKRLARDELRRLALIVADWRHRDHVPFIRSTGQNTAINRFDSLSIRNAGVKAAVEIHGHVITAKVVVPAPKSMQAAPRSASSSASTERPAT